jgi:integrase/recombinase XerD
VAFDLKAFFAVVREDPVEVTAADGFEFLADQRGDRTVVRLADRESGLSARTIARRRSSVSGLYAHLVARGDTPVRVNPGAARPDDPPPGRDGEITHGPAGPGAAHPAADLVCGGGWPARCARTR